VAVARAKPQQLDFKRQPFLVMKGLSINEYGASGEIFQKYRLGAQLSA
jgi:hypothetical protein